jgi:hypothetical protein
MIELRRWYLMNADRFGHSMYMLFCLFAGARGLNVELTKRRMVGLGVGMTAGRSENRGTGTCGGKT